MELRSPIAPRASLAGVAPRSWLLLIAIGAVLASVSLSRLHVFAVHQNERDALFLLERLAEQMPLEQTNGALMADPSKVPEVDVSRAGLDLRSLLRTGTESVERLGDLRWLQSGKILHRHGYLFDLVGTPGAEDSTLATFCLRAWPKRHGRTGIATFGWCSKRGLIGHPNRSARWDGLSHGPTGDVARSTQDWPVLPASLLR